MDWNHHHLSGNLFQRSMEKLPDLRNQLSSKDLFEAFKGQLVKDLEQNNFPAGFVGTLEPNYERIHQAMVTELTRNSKKSDFNLMQLLYRIDISEAQLKKYLEQSTSENHFEVVAELIIKRVLQKVVVKQYYKNTGRP